MGKHLDQALLFRHCVRPLVPIIVIGKADKDKIASPIKAASSPASPFKCATNPAYPDKCVSISASPVIHATIPASHDTMPTSFKVVPTFASSPASPISYLD